MSEVLSIGERGGIRTLTLNRPHAKNALDAALTSELGLALEEAAGDPAVRVVVLTGAGEGFCAGADLKAAAALRADSAEKLGAIIDGYHAMIRAIAYAPKPVVAAVHGPAVGFGCDLALACDLRVLSTEGYLQEKFVKIGLMPDGGGTFWLPRLVGAARAMELMLLGEPVRAEQALALGLVNRVVLPSELEAETARLAGALAEGPPLAYAGIKRATRRSIEGQLEAALAAEKENQIRCLGSNDCMEGVMAWMQKRAPHFSGN